MQRQHQGVFHKQVVVSHVAGQQGKERHAPGNIIADARQHAFHRTIEPMRQQYPQSHHRRNYRCID